MSGPLVSVVVPAYNTARTLPRCLDSILAQTMEDLEIIVVDDGSPDDVAEIASNYVQRDPRIRLIRQNNKGLGAARNTGIEQAAGTYLSFVDSDDFIESDMLEMMTAALSDTGALVANCEAYIDVFDSANTCRKTDTLSLPIKESVATGFEAFSCFSSLVPPVLNSVCFKLIKRTLFSEMRLRFPEDHRFAEDMPVTAFSFLHSDRVAFVHRPLYHYVRSNSILTMTFSPKKAHDLIANMNESCIYAQHAEYQDQDDLDAFRLEMLFSATRQITWSKEYRSSIGKELLTCIEESKPSQKPSKHTSYLPLLQKAKIDLTYSGWARIACRAAYHLRWMPLIKYML